MADKGTTWDPTVEADVCIEWNNMAEEYEGGPSASAKVARLLLRAGVPPHPTPYSLLSSPIPSWTCLRGKQTEEAQIAVEVENTPLRDNHRDFDSDPNSLNE